MKQFLFVVMLVNIKALFASAEFTSKPKGADEIVTHLHCDTKYVSDAGYSIRVLSGGFIGVLRVELLENNFIGARKILSDVPVKENKQARDFVTYLDEETNGSVFRLDRKITDRSGIFRAVVNNSPYPVPTFPDWGNLNCY
jgi:hypothetical protein